MNQHTYNGNDVFSPFNTGLYGIDDGDTDRMLLLDDSKAEILRAFKSEYETQIIDALAVAGMKYEGLQWYSPKFYNFETDSIDLKLTIADDVKYRAWCDAHKDEIQTALDANKSYDGYLALTPATYAEAWFKYDITIVRLALSGIDFGEFDMNEYLVHEYPCDECDRIHGHDERYGDVEQKSALLICETYRKEKNLD